jgi:8-oxo-dGTP pyrophosphatase MutT (NUDIX family)
MDKRTVTAKSISGEETQVKAQDLSLALSIYAVVVRDGKILISPQWKENGYDFPGGHIELGEEHFDALVREAKEETGFTVAPNKIIGMFTSFFTHPHTKVHQHSIQVYYSAEIISGEISVDGFDEDEKQYAKAARFVTLDELKSMEFINTIQEPLRVIMEHLEGITGGKNAKR